MADDTTGSKPENTPVPAERDDSTDKPVTELAHVDGDEDDADLKAKAGIDGKVEDASEQQQHVYYGLKDARAVANGDEPEITPMPFAMGPGNDVA